MRQNPAPRRVYAEPMFGAAPMNNNMAPRFELGASSFYSPVSRPSSTPVPIFAPIPTLIPTATPLPLPRTQPPPPPPPRVVYRERDPVVEEERKTPKKEKSYSGVESPRMPPPSRPGKFTMQLSAPKWLTPSKSPGYVPRLVEFDVYDRNSERLDVVKEAMQKLEDQKRGPEMVKRVMRLNPGLRSNFLLLLRREARHWITNCWDVNDLRRQLYISPDPQRPVDFLPTSRKTVLRVDIKSFDMVNKQCPLVLKIAPVDDWSWFSAYLTETEIQCKLDILCTESICCHFPIFVKAFGIRRSVTNATNNEISRWVREQHGGGASIPWRSPSTKTLQPDDIEDGVLPPLLFYATLEEQLDHTLRAVIKGLDRHIQVSLMYQGMHALRSLHLYTNHAHGNLHNSNIMLQRIDPNTVLRYQIKDRHGSTDDHYVNSFGWLLKIIDFDKAIPLGSAKHMIQDYSNLFVLFQDLDHEFLYRITSHIDDVRDRTSAREVFQGVWEAFKTTLGAITAMPVSLKFDLQKFRPLLLTGDLRSLPAHFTLTNKIPSDDFMKLLESRALKLRSALRFDDPERYGHEQ